MNKQVETTAWRSLTPPPQKITARSGASASAFGDGLVWWSPAVARSAVALKVCPSKTIYLRGIDLCVPCSLSGGVGRAVVVCGVQTVRALLLLLCVVL